MNLLIRGTLLYLTFTSFEVSCNWWNRKFVSEDYGFDFSTDSHERRDAMWHRDFDNEQPKLKRKPDNHIVAGVDPSNAINKKDCLPHEIRGNPYLSSSVECARSCIAGQSPKTCYYHFVLERYPINGQACHFCTPNMTNHLCPNCQCVPADGVERMALTVNRMIPGPSIQVCEGDNIVVDVDNRIKGESVSIHWHGIFQNKYQYFDGVPYVTQCPIPDQTTFRYQFLASNAGTHFWHAHTGLQKMDGIFGSLIVRQPDREEPNRDLYDFDLSQHVMVINDWMHEESTGRYPGRLTGVTGQLPTSILINGRGRYRFPSGNTTNTALEVITVKPNQRYRFRMVNSFCTVCPGQLTFEGHRLTVIDTDGQPIVPVKVDSIVSAAGERYDFIINTDQPPGAYWIQVRGLGNCQFQDVQQVAILQYEGASTVPNTPEPTYDEGLPRGVVLNPVEGNCSTPREDAICISDLRSAIPINKELLKPTPDVKIFLPLRSRSFRPDEIFKPNTYNQFSVPVPNVTSAALIDGINFKFPPSPPISQLGDIPYGQFCNSRNLPRGCTGNCTCTHLIRLPLNAVIECILIDEFQAARINHPFHLHGHAFHVLSMGQPFEPIMSSKFNPPPWKRINLKYTMELDQKKQIDRCFDAPPGKDTISVPNNGFVVFRFIADNPGYWLFHCHFVYHQMVGMDLIFQVGRQADLPPVPWNFPKCGNYKPRIQTNPFYPGK